MLCLYDSINYARNLNEFREILDCAYHGIRKAGLFIFDICTEKNSIKYFNNYFNKEKGKGYKYSRKSNYNFKSRIHTNVFKINFNNSEVVYVETHHQKIYYIDEMINIIKETKFDLINIFDGFTFKKGTEKSLRVHFVLTKV